MKEKNFINKLFARIGGIALAISLALGVGTGVALNNKQAKPLQADPETDSITITYAGFDGNPAYNSGAEYTGTFNDNGDNNIVVACKYVMANSGNMQCQANNANIYNKTAFPGRITNITVTQTGTARAFTAYGGTSQLFSSSETGTGQIPSGTSLGSKNTATMSWNINSGTNYYYFAIHKGANAGYVSSIVVTYETSGGGEIPEKTLSSIELSGTYPTVFTQGDAFSHEGMTVTAHYSDSSTSNVTASSTFSGYNMSSVGNQTVTVSYTESAVTKTATYGITVNEAVLVTCSVTYNPNGATSGTAPEDATVYDGGDSVAVLGNSGSLTKTGYIWSGWNTSADGTGVSYKPEDSFEISEDTTLYARWIADQSNSDNVVLTGDYLNLDSTGITVESVLTAVDGMQYSSAPGGANAVKSYTVTGDNKFVDSPVVMMGKTNAYLFNKDAFQKDIARIDIFNNGPNASTSVNVAVTFGTSICSVSNADGARQLNANDTVFSFSSSVSNARYFRIQITSNHNAQIQIKVVFVKPTTSVTVSPATVTLAPTETQQLTASVLPVDTTDTLTYTSSNNNFATVSNTGLITAVADGTATITVTSGEFSDTCVVTVQTPAEPFITVVDEEIGGFSGQNEAVYFTFGNLDEGLSIVSGNTGVATVGEIVTDGGTGLVQINYVGGGSTTISFKDGSTLLDSLSVLVTQTTVSLNKNSITIGRGQNEPLVATHNADNVGPVNWSSNNAKVTVDSNGVVRVAEDAIVGSNATITATSSVDSTVSASCSVTVSYPSGLLDIATSISVGDIVYMGCDDSSNQFNGISSTDTKYGLGFYYYDNPAVNYGVALEVCEGSEEDTFAFKLTSGDDEGKYLYWGSQNTINVNASVTANTSWTVSIDGSGNATITNVHDDARIIWWNNTNPRFACYAGASAGSTYKHIQLWKLASPETYINSDSTSFATLAYENINEVDVPCIKFGARFSQESWDAINATWPITGYGVMMTQKSKLDTYAGDTIKEAYEAGERGFTIKFKESNSAPSNYCFFAKVYYKNSENYDGIAVAAPFIVAGGRYYFLQEVQASVNQLLENN